MIEELFMAILMSVAFALPVYYLCQMQGSFFVFWLAWLISLADGIGESQVALKSCYALLRCGWFMLDGGVPICCSHRGCARSEDKMEAGGDLRGGLCSIRVWNSRSVP